MKVTAKHIFKRAVSRIEINEHAKERIKERLTPEITSLINKRIYAMADMLSPEFSYAVEVYRFDNDRAVADKSKPDEVDESGLPTASNGDMVVAIIRHGICTTTMLRRSPEHASAPQPFGPQAMHVDYAFRWKDLAQALKKLHSRRQH